MNNCPYIPGAGFDLLRFFYFSSSTGSQSSSNSSRALSVGSQETYACLNYGEAYCPKEIEKHAICLDGDTAEVLEEMK